MDGWNMAVGNDFGDRHEELGRRQFLVHLWDATKAVAVLSGALGAAQRIGAFAPSVLDAFASPTLNGIPMRESLQTLLGTSVDGCFAGDEHQNWQGKGRPHPSNAEPAHATGLQLFDEVRSETVVGPASGTLISFGSITSNQHVRDVFDGGNPLALPVVYDHSISRTKLGRWVGGEWYGTEMRPLRFTRDTTLSGAPVAAGTLTWAKVDFDESVAGAHPVKRDWLLITVLPNYLDLPSFDAGEKLLIVGGLHGTATESFPKVATHRELMTDIISEIGPAGCGQALVSVSGIHHDPQRMRLGQRHRTEAHEFQLAGAWPLLESDMRGRMVAAGLVNAQKSL